MRAPKPPLASGTSSRSSPSTDDRATQPPHDVATLGGPLPDPDLMGSVWNGPQAFYVLDGRGVVVAWNPAAEALWGITADLAVGRLLDDLIDWQPVSGPGRQGGTLAREERAWSERRLDRPQLGSRRGELIVVDTSSASERDRTAEVTRIVVSARDVTEPDRLQAQLLQAQKMEAVGQLVAGVAHELNNPLQAIIGFSRLLGNNPALPDELRSDAALLVTEATRTKRIVDNLLDFARHRPPERHPTRLGLLVQSVLDLQSYEISGGIAVEVDIPTDLPLVPLDRPMMQQVILNLTQNAIQAIRERRDHGTIRISASQGRDDSGAAVARLAIADDGAGVAEENRGRLFLPFFTTKAPGDGTGLGLSVSFGIVAGHGGHLWFEPGADGGSVFTIELPLEPSAEGRHRSAVVPGPVIAGADGPRTGGTWGGRVPDATEAPRLRILVLDDEETIRMFLVRVLSGVVDVVVAATGSEALRLIEEHDFDGMFCDHRMPGMTGTEVYERVAALRPELARRFILMSGDVLNPELLAFAEGRAVRLLSKPFEIETLQTIIEAMSSEIARGR